MRKTILISIILVLASTATAAYDPKNSISNDDSDIRILDSHTSDINFSQGNGTCGSTQGDLVNFDSNTVDDKSKVKVEGTVQTPNPCYELEKSLDRGNEKYILNINSKSNKEICVQCIGSINYSAEIDLPENTSLEVIHDGEQVGVFEQKIEDEKKENNSKGLLARILAFFGF